MTAKRYFGTIRQRDSGRWQIRYRTRSGKRVSYPETFARRAEAARVLGELERQVQSGGPLLDTSGGKVEFGAYADRWLDQHPGLRPRTLQVYRSLLRRHLAPKLGGVQLGQLSTATVREWRAGLLKAGVSDTMVAKSYRLLRAILNTAVTEDELIAVNPCKIKGAGEERSAERPALSVAQVYELVDLVPERWKAFVLLKTFASLRWGEITALRRRDVDLEKRTVRISRQFVSPPGGLQVGPPKSQAGVRMVSFPAAIMPELVKHLERFAVPGVDGLIFPNEHGQPFLRGNFDKAVPWPQIREQLGVPGLHLHDLRHTGNTLAAQSGASLRDLMVRMGHDSPAAALLYQHANRASDEAIAAAMDLQLNRRVRPDSRASHTGPGARVGPDASPSDTASSSELS